MAKKKAKLKVPEPDTKEFRASKEMARIEGRIDLRNQLSRQMRENERVANSVKIRRTPPRKATGAQ